MRIEDLLLNKRNTKATWQIIDDYKIWNHEEICTYVLSVRNSLIESNINNLDKVLILSDNSGYFVFGVIGVLATGAIVIPLSPVSSLDLIKAIIEETDPQCVLYFGGKAEKLLRENRNCFSKILTFNLSIFNKKNKSNKGRILKSGRCSDPAFILFSSGTIGKPKGIVLDHKAILMNISSIKDYMKPSSEDVFYIIKSIIHSSTLIGEILVSLDSGSKLIIKNPYVSPNTTLKRIEEYKPTILCLNPTILKLLALKETKKYDLSSLKVIYSSGALMSKELYYEAKGKFSDSKILNLYGLTEAGPRVSAQNEFIYSDKYVSVGKPIKNVQVKIQSESKIVNEPINIGEVYVKSPCLMLGYFIESKIIRKNIKNGWLKTGDIGFIDENGELFILGRSDDIIIHGAHNIDPNELENFICSFSGIKDCIIFGVPDAIYGYKLICAYSTSTIHPIIKNKIKLDLIRQCQEKLSSYQCPNDFIEWEEISYNSNGKKIRHLAQNRYTES